MEKKLSCMKMPRYLVSGPPWLVLFISMICGFFPLMAQENGTFERVLISGIHSALLDPGELDALAADLSDALSREGLAVIDAAARAAALKELDFSLSGVSTGRRGVGELVAASHIMTGSLGPAGKSEFILNLQLLNAETGEILKSVSRRYHSLALLLSDARNVAASLLLPPREVPEDYTVITASSQKSFFFFPLQYTYLFNEGETLLRTHGLGPSLSVSGGRPWGLMGGGGAALPFSVMVDSQTVAFRDLILPIIFEASLGVYYLADVGKSLLLQTAAGIAFQEFLGVEMFLDFGGFLSLNALYRLKLDEYINLGTRIIYYPHILPWSGPKDKNGLALQVGLSYGFGRN